MATSLLHALLEQTHNFTEEDFARLSDATRRLLRAELYEALNRDARIMPLLVNMIKEDTNSELFKALKDRVRENYEQISARPQPPDNKYA